MRANSAQIKYGAEISLDEWTFTDCAGKPVAHRYRAKPINGEKFTAMVNKAFASRNLAFASV